MTEHRGVGVYLRQLDSKIHGTPSQVYDKAKKAGLARAHILALWQQQQTNKEFNIGQRLVDYAFALHEAGAQVRLWAYPQTLMEASALRILAKRKAELGHALFSGFVLDPEKHCKWGGLSTGKEVTERAAAGFLNDLVDLLDEGSDLWVTSYGMASYHPTFPWDVWLSYGTLSPQVYGFTRPLLQKSLASWRALRASPDQQIVPIVAGYGDYDEENLGPWLDMFHEEEPSCQAFDVWSWRQLSSREWGILERYKSHD